MMFNKIVQGIDAPYFNKIKEAKEHFNSLIKPLDSL